MSGMLNRDGNKWYSIHTGKKDNEGYRVIAFAPNISHLLPALMSNEIHIFDYEWKIDA